MPSLFMDTTPLKESRDYRRIWMGSVFSTMGFQITAIAIALEIFSITGSPGAVGLTGLVAVGPLILGGLYGGVIADTYDRRKVALLASISMWLVTVAIAVHAWMGLHNIWLLYGLVALESLLQPINQAARGAIIPRLVRRRLLPAANALNMTVGTLGMSVGPMLGGALVATVGYPWTYSINVFAMMVGVWALYELPPMVPEKKVEGASRGIRSVVEGFSFVRQVPVVGMTFVVDLIGMIFAQAKPLIPALVVVAFGGGDAASGLLLSAGAVGAFLGVTFSGWLKNVRRQGRFLTLSYVGWGAGFFAFGAVAFWLDGRNPSPSLAENLWAILLGGAGLAFAGWCDALGSVFRSTIIQTAAPDSMLGRMNGMFIVTVTGGPNLGTALVGGVAQLVGSAVAAMLGGAVCILAIGGFTLAVPALWRYVFEPDPETNALPEIQHNPDHPATASITIVPPKSE